MTVHPCSIATFCSNTTFFFFILDFSSLTLGYLPRNFVKKSITLPFSETTRPILSFSYNIKIKIGVLCFCLINTTQIGGHTNTRGVVLSFFAVVWQHFSTSSSAEWLSVTRVFRSISDIFHFCCPTLRCNSEHCIPFS